VKLINYYFFLKQGTKLLKLSAEGDKVQLELTVFSNILVSLES
jgi:hypothetical protein